MKVWFMYDNHTFALVGDAMTTRAEMVTKARNCFAEDRYGSLFARDSHDRAIADLGGPVLDESQMAGFFDTIEEHANWEARG